VSRILVVDDDAAVTAALCGYLRLKGHEAFAADGADAGLDGASRHRPDAVLLDVFLRGKSGLDLVEPLVASGIGVIMISGHADVKTAVEAIRRGAFDFLEKPVDTDRLDILLSRLEREGGYRRGVERLRGAWREENLFAGRSPAMREALGTAERAASSRLTILITGESGTGKEVVARLIHTASDRVGGPFVAVNCSALPPDLAESALFGHRRGAFTGAEADREGFFRAADGGTLFLDEIGDLPLALQPKLLRALENGEIQGVGASGTERVDVRILAATNRPLEEAIRRGLFREDLYWRLGQLPLRIPPLRERPEDVRGLAEFFCSGRGVRFSEEALRYMEDRSWPGNVRELKNLVERAAVLARSDPVTAEDLAAIDAQAAPRAGGLPAAPMSLADAKRDFERRYVSSRLAAHGGSVKETAEELGLLPNNLSRKIAELGIAAMGK